MVTNSLEKKNVKKMILTATAVVGTSALLYMGFFQAVSASEQEKGGEVENLDLPEAGNITPELPDPVGGVPSDQTEGEATVEQEVSSAQPEGDFPDFAMPEWLYDDIKTNAPHVLESNEATFNYIKEYMPHIFENGIIGIKGYTDEMYKVKISMSYN